MDEVFAPAMLVALHIALLESLFKQMLLLTALHASMYLGGIEMGRLELDGEIKIFLPLWKTLLG